MKLVPPVDHKASAGEGDAAAGSETVTMMEQNEREEDRSTSSLDIKVDDPTRLTIPPTTTQQQQSPRVPPKQQQQEVRTTTASRERAASGIPPKMKLSDLGESDEEAMYRAIQDNPEMAAVYKAMLEKEGIAESDKDLDAYPDHLKSMMKEGVPVTQWIVLLVLLAFGAYQLRKNPVAPSKSLRKKTVEKKGHKQKGKKSYGGPSKTRSAPAKEKLDTATPIEEELVELLSSEPSQAGKESKKLSIRSNAKKKKARQAKKSKSEPVPVVEDKAAGSADSISTDDSSTADLATDTEVEVQSSAQHVAPILSTPVEEEPVLEESDGWKTVRKPGKSEVPKETITVAPTNGKAGTAKKSEKNEAESSDSTDKETQASVDCSLAPPSTPEDTPATTAEPATASAQPTKPAAESKQKTAKRRAKSEQKESAKPAVVTELASKAKADQSTPENNNSRSQAKANHIVDSTSVEDDEALAMELQQQEEAFALQIKKEEDALAESEPENIQDTWAEVTPKKSKKKSNGA